MTIQTFQPGTDVAPSHAIGSIVQWAENLSTAAAAIRLIVDTPFMPVSFWPMPRGASIRDYPTPQLKHPRETEAEYVGRRELAVASGAIAVVKGDEVGLTPQAALESIYVVRGKPGMYAETMEALGRSHGHRFQIEQLDNRICRMRTRRADEEEWQRFEFSVDRAKGAGYVKNNPKYNDDPQTMLHARCRSIAVRGTCPEVLKGLASVEEIEDETPDERVKVTTRTIQRTTQGGTAPRQLGTPAESRPASAAPAETPPAATDLPPLPSDEVPKQEVATERRPLLRSQWDRINLWFVRSELAEVNGPGQKAARLKVLSHMVDRVIAQGSDLSEGEGVAILDTLAGNGEAVVATALEWSDEPEPAPAAEPVAEPEPTPFVEESSTSAADDVAEVEDLPDPGDADDPWSGA